MNLFKFCLFVMAVITLLGCNQNLVEDQNEPTGIRLLSDSTLFLFNGSWIHKDTTLELSYTCNIDSVSYLLFQTWDDSLSYQFAGIPDSSLSQVNHGLGQWLRNSYGLWGRSCLTESFWAMNVIHPDDMAAIILTNYHRKLNDQPVKITEQVDMYKKFWKNEFNIEYRLTDSFDWEFPPSMWDMGITEYEK